MRLSKAKQALRSAAALSREIKAASALRDELRHTTDKALREFTRDGIPTQDALWWDRYWALNAQYEAAIANHNRLMTLE